MKTSQLTALLLGLTLFASTAHADEHLNGVVKFQGPIHGATILLLDRSGRVILKEANATGERGIFTVALPAGLADHLDGAQLEATGGRDGFEEFHGTLRRILTPDAIHDRVHLNAATTLSATYQDYHHDTVADADARTLAYLDIEVPNLGYSIENPYLKDFSPRTLAKEANAHGGFDSYMRTLAHEMTHDQASIHRFPAPRMLQDGGMGMWIGEKLVSGIVGAIGAQAFAKFQAGIGFPSEGNQTFELLQQVAARLVAIETALHRIEAQMKQDKYDDDVKSIWEDYKTIMIQWDRLQNLNDLAAPNTEKEAKGQPIDEALAADVRKGGKEINAEFIRLALPFVAKVNAKFVRKSPKPFQEIFAEIEYGQRPVIDQTYEKALKEQVEEYKTYQVIAGFLYVSAQGVENKTLALSDGKTIAQYLNQEQIVYPFVPILHMQVYHERIAKGEGVFDKAQNLAWVFGYQNWNDTNEYYHYMTSKRKPMDPLVPEYQQVKAMLEHWGKKVDRPWKDIAADLHFKGPVPPFVIDKAFIYHKRYEYWFWLPTDNSNWAWQPMSQTKFDDWRAKQGIKTKEVHTLIAQPVPQSM